MIGYDGYGWFLDEFYTIIWGAHESRLVHRTELNELLHYTDERLHSLVTFFNFRNPALFEEYNHFCGFYGLLRLCGFLRSFSSMFDEHAWGQNPSIKLPYYLQNLPSSLLLWTLLVVFFQNDSKLPLQTLASPCATTRRWLARERVGV